MSMVLFLRAVTEEELARLFKEPKTITVILADEELDEALTDEGLAIDLDKAWHAIHYLLTGSPDGGRGPEAFLVAGGRTIGDVEVGYGPARGLTTAETRTVDRALAAVTSDMLAARFDGAKLDAAKIYPEIWAADQEEQFAYIAGYYETLRAFVKAAAAKGMGLLMFMA